jgi:SNF2 family DNA or RNA helicase
MIPQPFEHQRAISQFILDRDAVFCTSDPGTGKTRAVLDAIEQLKHLGRTLVIAPKSILVPSWAEDIKKFTPNLQYSVATAENREVAFKINSDVVITNHDAVHWIKGNMQVLEGFYTLVVDESTAFKNSTALRSKAIDIIAKRFKKKIALTGTPTPNGLIDIWHQIKILDDGERLGSSYWKFRSATHTPIVRKAFKEWVEKDGIEDAIYGLISDMNIRYKLEECIDMPEHIITTIPFELSSKHMKLYRELKAKKLLNFKDNQVNALNAAALATKLMQCASGSIYGDEGYTVVDTERYQLVIDLVLQRPQSVVAFIWEHQKDQLIALAEKHKITYAVVDGSVSSEDRNKAVSRFQDGHIQVIFANPQSASHGLTLTAGTATIWASPTYNAEHFLQFNRRIYRAGQTQRTETILVAAKGTIDEKAYEKLQGKVDKQEYLLELLTS